MVLVPRLSLKVFEFAHPQSNTMEHFETCYKVGRYHVPALIYILTNIHHLFLVLNSSINFIIYCCVGKEFRRKLVALFCKKSVWKVVWPDWAIYLTLGNFSKPQATIIFPTTPTFLGNFCKGVKICNLSSEIIFGQLLQTFGDFYWSHCWVKSFANVAY